MVAQLSLFNYSSVHSTNIYLVSVSARHCFSPFGYISRWQGTKALFLWSSYFSRTEISLSLLFLLPLFPSFLLPFTCPSLHPSLMECSSGAWCRGRHWRILVNKILFLVWKSRRSAEETRQDQGCPVSVMLGRTPGCQREARGSNPIPPPPSCRSPLSWLQGYLSLPSSCFCNSAWSGRKVGLRNQA